MRAPARRGGRELGDLAGEQALMVVAAGLRVIERALLAIRALLRALEIGVGVLAVCPHGTRRIALTQDHDPPRR